MEIKKIAKSAIMASAVWALLASGSVAAMGQNGAGQSTAPTHQNAYQTGNMDGSNTGDQPLDGTGMHHASNFREGLGPQHYNFSVDISGDVFVNPNRFSQLTGGMAFIDENADGICDLVQDTDSFQALGIGPFVDENEDGIYDSFQTRGAYHAMGMNNFVDADGDGLCDNYEADPVAD